MVSSCSSYLTLTIPRRSLVTYLSVNALRPKVNTLKATWKIMLYEAAVEAPTNAAEAPDDAIFEALVDDLEGNPQLKFRKIMFYIPYKIRPIEKINTRVSTNDRKDRITERMASGVKQTTFVVRLDDCL